MGYQALDEHSKQTSATSTSHHAVGHSNGNGFAHTIQIGMSPISQLNEEHNENQTPVMSHEINAQQLMPLQSADSAMSVSDDEESNLYRALRKQVTMTPEQQNSPHSPQNDEESEAHLEKMWTEREDNENKSDDVDECP